MTPDKYVEVAVEAPLPQVLTYRLPQTLWESTVPGSRVEVPLGKRKARGVVLSDTASAPVDFQVKDIFGMIDDPPIGEKTRKWLRWLATYYIHPPGQVYSLAFSPGEEKRKKKSRKTSPVGSFERDQPPTPNEFQKKSIDAIIASSQQKKFETFLLFGVTGSGKTEVYLQSIDAVLRNNQQALVLVPEISLTPQLIKRFVSRFGEKVAVIHSHLTDRERADQWWSAVKKEKSILVGARSALFCPLENLGLIIVDEEHEGSFKQDEKLKYNARDAAIMRAQFSQCPIVLGSATPSLESWQNSLSGKYRLLELPARVEDRPLPQVTVIDMRTQKHPKESILPFWLSQELYKNLKEVFDQKEQAALFLNRRGFAQFLLCPGCGYSESCPNCSVTMTVHSRALQIICHYCGLEKPVPPTCTSCKQTTYKPLGLGTEKVCDDLQLLFPEIRIARADRDEINSREKLEALLDQINSHQVDVIVGTQMIAKGHDFPNLTLVGAVLADVGLHLPDFRSAEKTFQLLTQVAGRAGRHQKEGRVVIQTFVPEHNAILMAQNHDFRGFAQSELAARQELSYPPFGKLAVVRLQGINLDKTIEASDLARRHIDSFMQTLKCEIEVLGPSEAAIAKVRNKHRFQILLKSTSATHLNFFLQHFIKNFTDLPSGVKVTVDVDPIQFL